MRPPDFTALEFQPTPPLVLLGACPAFATVAGSADWSKAIPPELSPAEESNRMNGVNQVFLMGYLGADPELQTTKRGKPYTRLSLATHHRMKNEEGESQTTTTWHRVMVWGKNAELCKTYLQKGAPVAVQGALSKYSGEREDGTEFTQTSVTAHRVHFVGSRTSLAPSAFDEPAP